MGGKKASLQPLIEYESSLAPTHIGHLLPKSTGVQPVLFTVEEAGVYLGRSDQSIQHLIAEHELPAVRVGRRVHLHRTDLDRFIEKNKY